MHKKIKMLSMVSITSLMIGVNIQSVNAFENTSLYTSYSNVDVAEDSLITYIEPLDENYLLSQQDKNNSIELYGLNIPTSTHNLKTQGKMSFSGSECLFLSMVVAPSSRFMPLIIAFLPCFFFISINAVCIFFSLTFASSSLCVFSSKFIAEKMSSCS